MWWKKNGNNTVLPGTNTAFQNQIESTQNPQTLNRLVAAVNSDIHQQILGEILHSEMEKKQLVFVLQMETGSGSAGQFPSRSPGGLCEI